METYLLFLSHEFCFTSLGAVVYHDLCEYVDICIYFCGFCSTVEEGGND